MKEENLESLRENYSQAKLNKADLDPNPFVQFKKWFNNARAAEILEPNAMALATVNKEGNPSSRTVLLKSYDEKGFVFYTNFESDKAKDIQVNPNVAVSFLWKEIERQLRISGKIESVDQAQTIKYFQSRPRGSQIGAWVSLQSSVITDRSVLEIKKKEIEERFKNDEVLPVPDFWGGYRIVPNSFEFWQGRNNRLHDRLRYKYFDKSWSIERLSP